MSGDLAHDRAVKVHSAAGLPDTDIICASFTTHRFPVHAHAEHLISVVTEGAETFRHGRVEAIAPTGSLVLLNPFEEHTGAALGPGWRHVAMLPSPALIAASFGGEAVRFDGPVRSDPVAALLLIRLAGLARAAADALTMQSGFVVLADRLLGHHSLRPARSGQGVDLRRAREMLDEDPAGAIGLAELASAAGATPLTFLRSFRQAVGCTPQVYRTARRLQMARAALKNGGALAHVAAEAGFCDQSHLTRVFQRWLAVTPGDYQKTARP